MPPPGGGGGGRHSYCFFWRDIFCGRDTHLLVDEGFLLLCRIRVVVRQDNPTFKQTYSYYFDVLCIRRTCVCRFVATVVFWPR